MKVIICIFLALVVGAAIADGWNHLVWRHNRKILEKRRNQYNPTYACLFYGPEYTAYYRKRNSSQE